MGQISQSDASRYRLQLRKVVLKLRGKNAGLYVKDMYDTREYKNQDEVVKPSLLSREIMLQNRMREVADQIFDLKSNKGMLRWAVFKEEKANINSLLKAVNRTYLEDKHRHLEVGLFYLKPRQDVYDVEVRSHLFCMPLKEALKRRRLEKKKRKQVLSSYYTKASLSNTTTGAGHASVTLQKILGKAYTTKLMLYTVVSIVLGFIIIFF